MQGPRKAGGRLRWPPHPQGRRYPDVRRPIPCPIRRPGHPHCNLGGVLDAHAAWPSLALALHIRGTILHPPRRSRKVVIRRRQLGSKVASSRQSRSHDASRTRRTDMSTGAPLSVVTCMRNMQHMNVTPEARDKVEAHDGTTEPRSDLLLRQSRSLAWLLPPECLHDAQLWEPAADSFSSLRA